MLTLTAGLSSLVVAPRHGAGVVGWLHGGRPVLRRALPAAAVGGDPHAMGCFPLIPYANRIAHGGFRWGGADYPVALNFGDHPHAIHGIGWQRAWTVEAVTSQTAVLSLEHRADESWPFAFQASIAYRLTETELGVTMRLTNRHDGPAPGGFGIHPYFPKADAPALRFAATGAWVNGPDMLPERHGAVPGDWDHRDARPVGDSRLDNCFTGWDGRAAVQFGTANLEIRASDIFRNLQVFTPSWADFFCVEPVSHVPNAINRPDLPADQAMSVLAPDSCIEGTVCLGFVDSRK